MTNTMQERAVAHALARCIRKGIGAADGRTIAGARREALGALGALGVEQAMRDRMVVSALSVAEAVTRVLPSA